MYEEEKTGSIFSMEKYHYLGENEKGSQNISS